jgi:hypothetical protein
MLCNKTLVLALISPFKTDGADAARQAVFYNPRESLASLVTDIRNVRSCVGRVESRGKYGLIDRDLNLVRPTFATGERDESESDASD